MLSSPLTRALARQTTTRSLTASQRQGFATTRAQLGGHYPEGPGTNLPFNPRKKGFVWKYWVFMGTGFCLPIVMAVWQTNKNKA